VLVQADVEAGVEGQEFFSGTLDLGSAHVGGVVEDLALEVGDVDHVEVDQADRADARGGQVEGQWRTQAPRADAEDARGLEPPLARHRHLGHDQVAGVALNLVVGEGGVGGSAAEQVEGCHDRGSVRRPAAIG